MRASITRVWQIAILVVLGAVVVWLLRRPSHEHTTTAPAAASVATPPAPAAPSEAVPPPPSRPFKLPMPAVPMRASESEPVKAPPESVSVPKDWLLRGSGAPDYNVKSDRVEVLSGLASVRLASQKKDISPSEIGSLMQTIVGGPWAGTRAEFTVSVKSFSMRRNIDVWARVTDEARTVIEFRHAQSDYGPLGWQRYSIVFDVPPTAAEIAYGVSLRGVGALWVDDAHLQGVNRTVAATGEASSEKLGVVAQEADENGPLAGPSNMDFEDTRLLTETFRKVPQDELGRTRF